MKTTDKFVFFWSGIYSNWYPAEFYCWGQKFANSEQAFMWQKANFFHDDEVARLILAETDPSKVKQLGRLIKNYDDYKWSFVRYCSMYIVCMDKFRQNAVLLKELLATGDRILVEASPLDTIWGIGMSDIDDGVENPNNWRGQNLLGQVLMDVRRSLSAPPITKANQDV